MPPFASIRRLVTVALLLTATVGPAPSAWAGDPAAYRIAAGRYDRKMDTLADTPPSIQFTLKGLTVLVKYLDPAARAAFIQTIDPAAGDLFAPPPGRPQVYTAFRVDFDNQSTIDVTFQPGNVILSTDRKEHRFSVDLTDLYRVAARVENADPDLLMRRVAPLIFDSSVTIPDGSRLSRLLVFGPLPDKWKEFGLHFSFIQIGTETHSLSFPFHKQILER